jgi:hypothetical protein
MLHFIKIFTVTGSIKEKLNKSCNITMTDTSKGIGTSSNAYLIIFMKCIYCFKWIATWYIKETNNCMVQIKYSICEPYAQWWEDRKQLHIEIPIRKNSLDLKWTIMKRWEEKKPMQKNC